MDTTTIRIACLAACLGPLHAFAAPDAAQVARGSAAYEAKGCYECHGRAGQGSIMSGPALAGRGLPFAALDAYVRAPAGQMPPYSVKILSAADLQDITAFIDTLPAPQAAR